LPLGEQFGTLAFMAMKFFRDKRHSMFTIFLFGLIIISFIFWGVFQDEGSGSAVLTTVNGDPVSYSEFQRIVALRLEAFGAAQGLNKNLEQFIRRQVAQSLVSRKLLAQMGDRVGIVVGKDDVLAELSKIEAFQDPELKRFSPRIYQFVLERNGIEPRNFEKSLVEELKASRYRQLLDSMAIISPAEAADKFEIENTTANLWTAQFNVKSPTIAASLKPSEEDLKSFYEKNRERLLTPERRSFQIARLSLDDVELRNPPSEDAVEVYYNQKIASSSDPKWAGPRAQVFHILISDRSQEGLRKAQSLRRELQTQQKNSPSEFPKIFRAKAKETSEDYASAFRGGDLGYFSSSDMVKDFSDPVFKASSGDLLGPIKTDFGYHLVYVVDISSAEKSLNNRRNEIAYEISKEEKEKEIAAMKNQIRRDFVQKKNENTQKLIELGFEVTETAPLRAFDRSSSLPFALTHQAFRHELRAWVEPEEFEDSLLLVRSLAITAPESMSYEEALPEIQAELEAERLQAYVFNLYDQVKNKSLDFAQLRGKGAEIKELKNQKLFEIISVEGLPTSDVLLREIHSLRPDRPLGDPLFLDGQWILLAAADFKTPQSTPESLKKVQSELRTAKQTDFVEASLQKMLGAAKVPKAFKEEFGI